MAFARILAQFPAKRPDLPANCAGFALNRYFIMLKGKTLMLRFLATQTI
jgi:hypothetical protein